MMKPNDPAREAVIVAAARTPIGKAKRGSLASTRPDELAALVVKELLHRAGDLDPAKIDAIGAVLAVTRRPCAKPPYTRPVTNSAPYDAFKACI